MSGQEKKNDLFSGLEQFGFTELDNVSLYTLKNDQEEKKAQKKEKLNIEEDYLFDREVQCPICSSAVGVRALKRSALRLVSRDSDTMPVYKDINPLFYDIWICNRCGYANNANSFTQELPAFEREQIVRNICTKWKAKEYPALYTHDIAMERFKLALFNTSIRKGKSSEIAMLCLKMGWLYRSAGEKENERKCLAQALIGFKEAINREKFPVAGMDESSLMFMIGELSRRAGDEKEAIIWFGRVLADKNAKPALKDKARDQKDLINQESRQKEHDTKEHIEPVRAATPNVQKKGLGRFLT